MKILLFIIVLVGVLLFLQRLTRNPQGTPPPQGARVDGMDAVQARAVLGLEDTPLDSATIVAAHRRLMQHIHPDKGGSALLAQQLNEAKRILLAQL